MAILGRAARTAQSWRAFFSPKTLTPARGRSRDLPPRLPQSFLGRQMFSNATQFPQPMLLATNPEKHNLLPTLLACLLGAGMVQIAHADAADEVGAKPTLPSESAEPTLSSESAKPVLPSESANSPSIYEGLEEIAKKERKRIEDLLRSKGMRHGLYPRFTVAVKGQKVTIKFQVPSGCEIPQLIANLASQLGLKVGERGGSDMLLRAWDSTVAWQLTLSPLEKQKKTEAQQGQLEDNEEDLCVLIFRSLISTDKAEIEFMKPGSLSSKELDALVSVLQIAGGKLDRKPREGTSQMPSADKSVASLEAMGVKVYGLDAPLLNSSNRDISWDNIAGYEQQKREIEDTILLALHSPEVYDDIARGTRCKFESNRPRAVLFEGPPGTGKTSCARVIANQAGIPLLYVPLEVVMSKYYGESERLLGKVFSLANKLPNGALIFLDEVDSFAVARDNEMHEATRRVLSVLLRQIDGFEQDKKVVVIAATNRKQDLDPAFISRFDSMIYFGLPDQQNREEIAAQYAKHLTKSELVEFAKSTEGMSGRDIRDVCQQAERQWASKIIRGKAPKDSERASLPPLQDYMESAMSRNKALLSIQEEKCKSPKHGTEKYSANSPSEEEGKRKRIKEEAEEKKPKQIKEESAKSVEKRIEDLMRSKGQKIPSDDESVASLKSMGVKVYGLDAPPLNGHVQWGSIAGYHQQKREIEDTVLLPLRSPQVYDDIARGTRLKFESNRPRAVLFEGPPGTGKTSCACVIATQSGIPLLYVPLEIIMSKWYGDSTRLLGQVFSLANKLPNGALIFFDEIDSFAGVRGERMHEITRRILSVLLQEIDGLEQDKKVAVIAATNRKQDLDPALISRFDSVIYFGLPDQQSREQIVAQFAKHLTESELAGFATSTEGMPGRDIRDVCEKAERLWASKIIRGKVPIDVEEGGGSLPPLEEYIESAMTRKKAVMR